MTTATLTRTTVVHVRLSASALAHLDRVASARTLDRSALTRRMLAYAAANIGPRSKDEFHGGDVQDADLYLRCTEAEAAAVDRIGTLYDDADPWEKRTTRSTTVRRMLAFAAEHMPPAYRAPHEETR